MSCRMEHSFVPELSPENHWYALAFAKIEEENRMTKHSMNKIMKLMNITR